MSFTKLTSAIATLALVAVVYAKSEPGDYLDKDKLKAVLEVRDLQGGFAGLTGTRWTIKTDGSFEAAQVVGQRDKVLYQGKLTDKNVEALAKDLAKYDLAGLKGKGKEEVNPKVLMIKFGKDERQLFLGAGAEMPKVDAATIEGRYAGILKAVKTLAEGNKDKEKEK